MKRRLSLLSLAWFIQSNILKRTILTGRHVGRSMLVHVMCLDLKRREAKSTLWPSRRVLPVAFYWTRAYHPYTFSRTFYYTDSSIRHQIAKSLRYDTIRCNIFARAQKVRLAKFMCRTNRKIRKRTKNNTDIAHKIRFRWKSVESVLREDESILTIWRRFPQFLAIFISYNS